MQEDSERPRSAGWTWLWVTVACLATTGALVGAVVAARIAAWILSGDWLKGLIGPML